MNAPVIATVDATTPVVVDLPSKIVVNKVALAAAAGVVAGGLVVFGVSKFRNRNKVVVELPETPAEA